MVDGNGDIVGVLLHGRDSGGVLVRVTIGVTGENGRVILRAERGVLENSSDGFRYDNSGCLPPAYVLVTTASLSLMVKNGVVVDGVVYGPDLDAVPQPVTVVYYLDTSSNCIAVATQSSIVPAVAIKEVGPPPYEVVW